MTAPLPPLPEWTQVWLNEYQKASLQEYAKLAVREALERAQQAEPVSADKLAWLAERLSYHQFERSDLTLDEALEYLRTGWKRVMGRTERQLILQICGLLAAPPAVQAEPVGEWRMKNGEPMHVLWRAKYKPQLGDKLYAAPPAESEWLGIHRAVAAYLSAHFVKRDDEAVRLLRELRDNIVHNSSLREEYQEWNDSIEAIDAYLAKAKC